MFNTVFNILSVIPRWPMHLSMVPWNSFLQYSAQYPFKATGCFSTLPSSKQMDSGERGVNPVTMTIINLQEEYWPSLSIEPAIFCSQVLSVLHSILCPPYRQS